ncbi:MAG: oligosaccharide flippase family protein, partial [Actinobacteria bacterium]|nr:oligosaccharide flippase family protein [Actinomycetota bacterium]
MRRGFRRLRGAVGSALPKERFGDHLAILAGTGQNVLGLAVFVLATFGTNVLIARVLGESALGVVTLATQLAFIGGAATRFGMDVAATRRVAIDLGKEEPGRARGVVNRAVAIAGLVSLAAGLALFLAAAPLSRALTGGASARTAFQAAAVALPFVALSQVYLGATRGLKIMRHTLYIYWAGQPLLWIALMVGGWVAARTVGASVVAYGGSWLLATAAAAYVWRRETERFPRLPSEPGEVGALLRYGAPRAPAALLAQALFWADYFVLSLYVSPQELGVYAATVRVAQALVLFLIAVNYM